MVTFILFILILGLLVFVHEFGHFWVAKKSGIKVHEFAFGFRPRLFSWKRGETEYAINAIPLGGYVRLEGEQKETGKDSFMAQKPLVRGAVLLAGVCMNLVLAWVFLTFAYMLGALSLSGTFNHHPGLDSKEYPMVLGVSPNSPAEIAGLQVRDIILEINSQKLTIADQVGDITRQNAGKEITIKYQRGSEIRDTKAQVRQNPPEGEGPLGVGTMGVGYAKSVWYKAPYFAVLEVGSQIKNSFTGFIDLVKRLVVKHEVSENVTGIVGVGATTGIVRQFGLGALLQFIAIISVGLAVLNSMPILPLDGGHLLFVIIEAIRKKPVKESVRQGFALAGVAAFLLLMVIVTYQDFLRFAVIERLKNLF
jgi:regulator of sigma E protease